MADLDLTGSRSRPESDRPRPSPSATAESLRKKGEDALRSELEGVFSRLSDILEAREDEELATVLAEDKKVLSNGLVSLTSSVKPLRTPLVLGVRLIEPILAFGRILGILARRARARFYAEEEGNAPQA